MFMAYLVIVHCPANVAKALQLDLGFRVLSQEHVQTTQLLLLLGWKLANCLF